MTEYSAEVPEVYEATGAVVTEPVPVVTVGERHTAQTVSCMTWTIPQVGVGQPVQILQRRDSRFKAKITLLPGPATQIIFNARLDPLQGNNPQGATYVVPGANVNSSLPDWENEKPLYAIAITASAQVSVQDEAYAV